MVPSLCASPVVVPSLCASPVVVPSLSSGLVNVHSRSMRTIITCNHGTSRLAFWKIAIFTSSNLVGTCDKCNSGLPSNVRTCKVGPAGLRTCKAGFMLYNIFKCSWHPLARATAEPHFLLMFDARLGRGVRKCALTTLQAACFGKIRHLFGIWHLARVKHI